MSNADLLRRTIDASGLSARQFAKQILLRDERTVRRWLAGDSPLPESVVSFLKSKQHVVALLEQRKSAWEE